MIFRLLVSLFCFCILFANTANAQQTILIVKSPPGDYIGGGVDQIYTPSDAPFVFMPNYHGGISLFLNNFNLFLNLDLAAPGHIPLTVGSYENATRFPFQSLNQPGLSFGGNGRGCNTLTGRFQILEMALSPDGQVEKFAVDFEQSCEGFMPTLLGQLRYNSSVPTSNGNFFLPKITIETPLNFQSCVEAIGPQGAAIKLNGLASRDSLGGTNLTYAWSTASGLTGLGPNFSLNLGVNKRESVLLTVKDGINQQTRSVSREVCVSDTTPPKVEILSPLSGQIYTKGGSVKLSVRITDAVDKNITKYQTFVGSNATYSLDKNGESKDKLLSPDNDNSVQIFFTVNAYDSSGNFGSNSVFVIKAK